MGGVLLPTVILRGALLRRTISVRLTNQTDGRRMPQMQPLNCTSLAKTYGQALTLTHRENI